MTVDRDRFALPADFMVIATQNPREFEGTFPLPESQLDRFMMRIVVDYPQRDAETEILHALRRPRHGPRTRCGGAMRSSAR